MSNESQRKGVYVGERCIKMEGGSARVCECAIFFCFDLPCYYPPAVKCAAVMAPHETRRQTERGFLLSEGCDESSSPAVMAHSASYVSRRKRRREGGKMLKTMSRGKKKNGKRKKCQAGSREARQTS